MLFENCFPAGEDLNTWEDFNARESLHAWGNPSLCASLAPRAICDCVLRMRLTVDSRDPSGVNTGQAGMANGYIDLLICEHPFRAFRAHPLREPCTKFPKRQTRPCKNFFAPLAFLPRALYNKPVRRVEARALARGCAGKSQSSRRAASAVPTGSCGTDEKHRLRCGLRIPLLHDVCIPRTGLCGHALTGYFSGARPRRFGVLRHQTMLLAELRAVRPAPRVFGSAYRQKCARIALLPPLCGNAIMKGVF